MYISLYIYIMKGIPGIRYSNQPTLHETVIFSGPRGIETSRQLHPGFPWDGSKNHGRKGMKARIGVRKIVNYGGIYIILKIYGGNISP